MIYYNVYNSYGDWIGSYVDKYQAEVVAEEYDGWYIEEEE